MPIIESQQDWWDVVKKNTGCLRDLVAQFHPTGPRNPVPVERALDLAGITAPGAEAACREVRMDIAEKERNLAPPLERFDKALEEKDWETLGRLFSATWFGVPESHGAWSLAGFGALCDLCSENWVFYEEDR